QLLGLAVQDLLGQVVQHVPVAAGERRDEAARVVPSPQRQGGQLQACSPAFGAGGQRGDGGLGQAGSQGGVEHRGRLLGGEAQVAGAQLDQLAAAAQPCQRQRGVAAGRKDQP